MPISTDVLYTAELTPVNGFEGLYSISECGLVYSHISDGFLKPVIRDSGRPYVTLCKDGGRYQKAVYRLVAETFIPNPENKPQVNHLDGDVSNSAKLNLEWATEAENSQHAVINGLRPLDEDHQNAVLNNEQVVFCRSHYIPRDREFSYRGLARRFKVNPSTIQRAVEGKTYKGA